MSASLSSPSSSPTSTQAANAEPLHTPLHALHLELGARMVPFAGYAMPVQYPGGIIKEHHQCRQAAALFDVSHMGQISVSGADAAAALESLLPVDVQGLSIGQQRYAFFTNPSGGILDDLMVTRLHMDAFLLVVNAACKDADLRHLQTHIGHRCQVQPLPERALLALQGPQAAQVMARLNLVPTKLLFMNGCQISLAGFDCFITRSGYTGEDGFEISVLAEQAEALARTLLSHDEVAPVGLGARDTLRLEAGLCLHGHDIDARTTPIEAGLGWAIQKVRRQGERAGGYPGADVIHRQIEGGVTHKRIGLVGLERVPVREGTPVLDAHGHKLGTVTSGTIAPTVDKPIAMAYLPVNHAVPQGEVFAEVRGKRYPMRVTPMPFAPHRYHRG